MLKLLLLVIFATAFADVPENKYRFFATTKTSTLVVLSTTTAPSTVKRTCWTSSGPTLTSCRRRRGIEEQPEISVLDVPLTEQVQPSQVLPLEPTQHKFLDEIPTKIAEISNPDLQGSTEFEINGSENCLARSALGITVLFTTSTTVVVTQRTATTVGSVVFQLASCIPKVIENSQC